MEVSRKEVEIELAKQYMLEKEGIMQKEKRLLELCPDAKIFKKSYYKARKEYGKAYQKYLEATGLEELEMELEATQNFCLCGCGMECKRGRIYIAGHSSRNR